MVDNKTETIDCSWDGGPTRRAAWFKKLPKAMALKGHRTLWERGVTTDRGRITITATPEHSWQFGFWGRSPPRAGSVKRLFLAPAGFTSRSCSESVPWLAR